MALIVYFVDILTGSMNEDGIAYVDLERSQVELGLEPRRRCIRRPFGFPDRLLRRFGFSHRLDSCLQGDR